MTRKRNNYKTSLIYDRDNPKEMEVISKMLNRDRSKFHSISQYVLAAVLAFDDKNPRLNYSDAAKQDLIDDLRSEMNRQTEAVKNEMSRQAESMKYYFVEEVITKFGE